MGCIMLKEVYAGIYNNEIVLPNNPLKMLNCFIIKGDDRNIIIDTGFNRPECEEAFLQGIQELGLDMEKTDLFLTHLHSDHVGLAPLAQRLGARVYTGAKEAAMVRIIGTDEYWEFFYKLMKMYGLDEYGLSAKDHPGYRFRPDGLIDCLPLQEGEQLKAGGYTFTVVDTPGHTLGHTGLYEEQHKLFFCGDHVLGNITPNIICWGPEKDSLAIYLDSLKKLAGYDVKLLLTGHRELVRDHKARIDELLRHHEVRLAEAQAIISEQERPPCEVAARMTWDLKIDKWEDFPKAQKWFSSGEAMSHLEHLFHQGRADRREQDGVYYYKCK